MKKEELEKEIERLKRKVKELKERYEALAENNELLSNQLAAKYKELRAAQEGADVLKEIIVVKAIQDHLKSVNQSKGQ